VNVMTERSVVGREKEKTKKQRSTPEKERRDGSRTHQWGGEKKWEGNPKYLEFIARSGTEGQVRLVDKLVYGEENLGIGKEGEGAGSKQRES